MLEADSNTLHIPFDRGEISQLAHFLAARLRCQIPTVKTGNSSLLRSLIYRYGRSSLKLQELAAAASCTLLKQRTAKSILAFLKDLLDESLDNTTVLRSSVRRREPATRTEFDFASKAIQRATCTSSNYKDSVLSTIGPSKSYTYMSGDVGTIAFAANSNVFIAGSVCDESPEYNYPGNFVLGDASSNLICTIDHHWKAVQDKQSSSSSRIFYTVAMADFSADGTHFFSGGYDSVLRAYGSSDSPSAEIAYIEQDTAPRIVGEAPMNGPIDLLRTSKIHDLIALGTQASEAPILITRHIGDSGFDRSMRLPIDVKKNLHPSCLQWAPAYAPNLLLGGFMDAGEDVKGGELALWDVQSEQKLDMRNSQGVVFDVNWSSQSPIFAAAMRPQHLGNKSARSLIRIYDPRNSGWARSIEMDCTAKDINDVVISPHDENIVAAGTTEGNIFIYDLRYPNGLPNVLRHGSPIDRKTEKDDTGVRFCAWNHSRHGLITGSSDGIVKSWDVYRAVEDAYVEDVATFSSGIYSGAFSPDHTRLAIGEVKKTITILEPFNKGRNTTDLDGFEIVKNKATGLASQKNYENVDMATTNSLRQRQCQIPLCLELEQLEDEASLGDNRRWEGRIPAALKPPDGDAQRSGPRQRRTMFQAIRKCMSCGMAARPSADLEKPLCERCGFSCTRCGSRIQLSEDLDQVICPCGGNWTIGALGYEKKSTATKPIESTADAMSSLPLGCAISPPGGANNAHSTPLVDERRYAVEHDSEDADEYQVAELYMQLWNLKLWNKDDSSYIDLRTGRKLERPGVLDTTTRG